MGPHICISPVHSALLGIRLSPRFAPHCPKALGYILGWFWLCFLPSHSGGTAAGGAEASPSVAMTMLGCSCHVPGRTHRASGRREDECWQSCACLCLLWELGKEKPPPKDCSRNTGSASEQGNTDLSQAQTKEKPPADCYHFCSPLLFFRQY